MNIDLLFTRHGEAGLLCDMSALDKAHEIKFDYATSQLVIDFGFDNRQVLNIPVEYFYIPYLLRLSEIHLGVIKDNIIQSVRQVPFTLTNCVVATEQQPPKARLSTASFQMFMRQCTSGQAVHRSDLSDETKTAGVLMGANPAVLKYAPQLVYQNGKQYAPAPTASPATPAPSLAPAPGGTMTISPSPLAPFVKGYVPPPPLPKIKNVSEDDLEQILKPLMNMIGIDPVKKAMRNIAHLVQSQVTRQEAGLTNNPISMHMIFSGPPGTGKTTVARELGRILADLGYLAKGHVVEVARSDLTGNYVGDPSKKTLACVNRALDGILFIDEAYNLNSNDESNIPDGKEVIATLLKLMEDHRGRLIVIAAGYPLEMHKFLESNPGLKSRFSNIIDFPNYSADELTSIFKNMCMQGGYVVMPDAIERVHAHVSQLNTSEQINAFGNARGIRNIYEKSILGQASRVVAHKILDREQLQILTVDDVLIPQRKSQSISSEELESLLAPLNALVGLETVKQEVTDLIHFLHVKMVREERGLPSSSLVLHSIFSGPPGTGKTSVARLLGKILFRLGFLEKGHVVEVDRSKMIGRWTGHTPQIVAEVFKEAEGGILFIDEAYSLVETTEGSNFGYEAITTLLKLMEDQRDKVLVICAGYDNEMQKFLDKNPGLKSRFPQNLHFKPYMPAELITIFENLCRTEKYMPSQEALAYLHTYLSGLGEEELNQLGNARLIRNIFEKTIRNQSRRISKTIHTNPDLTFIEVDDIGLPQESHVHKVGFI